MKIISFGIWGNNPLYTNGLIKNCYNIKTNYPEWNVWVYYNNTVPSEIISHLTNLGISLFHIDNVNTTGTNSVWRFYPTMDESVDILLSRDCDSRITNREMHLVNEWINSDKELHIIRDHAWHQMPILAGMFGLKRGSLMNTFKDELSKHLNGISIIQNINDKSLLDSNMYQFDELFLQEKIFPLSAHKRMTHISAGAMYEGDIIIPPPINNDFIGNKINQDNDKPIIEYITGITRK